MRKTFKKKLSGPSKLVRKVLSKSSILSSTKSNENLDIMSESDLILTKEIEVLKDQIQNLKNAVTNLHEETEHKEMNVAKLAKEKENISHELLQQKRSNICLIQQLEDERKFYYEEKERYCKDMNDYKKLKRLLSTTTVDSESNTPTQFKLEIAKLKQTLNETLEANYNLSVKFLRLKNTKTFLKTQLKQMKLDHDKLVVDLKTKIENLTAEANDLIKEKLTCNITPSNKKYLQLVKHNSCLTYENLCLQLEVDNLNLRFDRLDGQQARSESNSKLQFIQHNNLFNDCHRKHHRINKDGPGKLKKEKPSSTHLHSTTSKERNIKVTTIFDCNDAPKETGQDENKRSISRLEKEKNLSKVSASKDNVSYTT